MLSRLTLPTLAALALTLGACADSQSRIEEEAGDVVQAFQAAAADRLESIGAQLDTARMELDSLSGDAREEARMALDTLAARRADLQQRIEVLAWRTEVQWDSVTQELEGELTRLRADIARAIAPEESSMGDPTS